MNDPNRYSGLSDEQLRWVHAACETFEQALRNDKPIYIEDCLAAVSEHVRDFLFRELLAIELEWQRARERSPEIVEYRARFPDRHDDLERGFLELFKAGPATGFLKEFGRYPIDGVPDTGPREPGQNTAPSSISVPGYEVEGVLGRGGMGVVYKARNLKLKRTVALKMVLASGHAGPRELARFRIEAEAAARLQHPNIVQIHEVGTADGYPCCALEFVDGGNLAARLADKPMPAGDSAKLVETLARAMHLAHSRNVVHRDLKPANILLTVDGTPKISDFGLARQMDSDSGETQAGAVMGTPAYMAPEQASGHAHHAGPAADVYALGAILYDCLAGRPPFKGSSVVETLDQVRTQEPAPPSRWQTSVPLDLDTISLKCLRKEPEKRYASAAEMADDLVRYLNGEPILARQVGRIERAGKWVQRNPMVATSLAGLTGIILSAFLLVSRSYLRAEDALKEEAMQRHAADVARDAAQREQKAERWARYRSDIAAASAALQVQNNGVALSALEDAPKQHRNWEWQYLHGQLEGAQLVLPLSGGGVDSFILSPSGRQVAVRARHDQINLYGVASGTLEAVLRGHSAQVMSIAYRPDGKQIATYGEDQTIRLWDPSTGQQITLLRAEFAPPPTWSALRTLPTVRTAAGLRPILYGKERPARAACGTRPPVGRSPSWRNGGKAPVRSLSAPMASVSQWVPGSTYTCATPSPATG